MAVNKLHAWPVTAVVALSSAMSVTGSTALAAATRAAEATTGRACSIQAPARLVVVVPTQRVTARAGADCRASGTRYASWDVEHSRFGWQNVLVLDQGRGSAAWRLGTRGHLGTYHLRPSYAWDADAREITQNAVTTTVRLGSRMALGATRRGATVTLRTSVTHYRRTTDRFAPWAHAPVRLYTRTCPTCAWRHLVTLTTDRSGRAATSLVQPRAQGYQARVPDTRRVWGAAATMRR
jgi:hypothetical protein